MTEFITVVPAYGRDYGKQEAAVADWEAGKDFRIDTVGHRYDGKYMSCRDKTEDMQVTIRFANSRRTVVVN